MYKKDMIWIATATLIHPNITPTSVVGADHIESEIFRLFQDRITRIQLDTHLVSWKARDADATIPSRGGDRSRYFFKTKNGVTPSDDGDFRLYKSADSEFDGTDKTGTFHPRKADIPAQFHYLIDWYLEFYF